jgi:hypothetical protein
MSNRRWGYGQMDWSGLMRAVRDEPCPRHGCPIDPVIGGCSECLAELKPNAPTCPDCGRVVPPEPYADAERCIACAITHRKRFL